MTSPSYRGRFAPSPTGPLHFGSLLAALASFLDARANHGTWLVRMEDLDPPRESPGAAQQILTALSVHGLTSDEPVLYQSMRLQAYEDTLAALATRGLIYSCNCNRARLQQLGRVYDRHCLQNPPASTENCAQRLKIPAPDQPVIFRDRIQGPQRQCPAQDFGDYILKRKDGLHAYQLAVVADDIHQAITHVVRGSDLLEVSARQQSLFAILGAESPVWAHIPVINNYQGQKLSKQNHAPALDLARPSENLWHALRLLGQTPEPAWLNYAPNELLQAAVKTWQLDRIPHCMALTDPAYSQ